MKKWGILLILLFCVPVVLGIKIAQKHEVSNGVYETTSTSWTPTDGALGVIEWNRSKYDFLSEVYIEFVGDYDYNGIPNSAGSGQVRMINFDNGSSIDGSTMSWGSIVSWGRTANLSYFFNTEYSHISPQLIAGGDSTSRVFSARLVVVQDGVITKTRTMIMIGSQVSSISGLLSNPLNEISIPKRWNWTNSSWSGNISVREQFTAKVSSGAFAMSITNFTNQTGLVQSSNTSYDFYDVASIGLNNNVIYTSGMGALVGTGSMQNHFIVVDQTGIQANSLSLVTPYEISGVSTSSLTSPSIITNYVGWFNPAEWSIPLERDYQIDNNYLYDADSSPDSASMQLYFASEAHLETRNTTATYNKTYVYVPKANVSLNGSVRYQQWTNNTAVGSAVTTYNSRFIIKTPKDNSAPIAQTIRIVPDFIRVNDSMTCFANVTDPDFDSVYPAYNWHKDNRSTTEVFYNFNNITNLTNRNFSDYSGYKRFGSCQGAICPNYTFEGFVGSGLYFDGKNSANNWVNITNSTDIKIYNLTGFSVEAWVKFDNLVGDRGIVSKWDGAGWMLYHLNPASVRFYIANTIVNSTNTFSTGRWYHIVGTWDKENMTLYVNGTLSGTNTQAFINGNNLDTIIGSYNNRAASVFNGSIDEVKIYNYELSSNQVTQNYFDGLANYSNVTIVRNETLSGQNWTCTYVGNDYKLNTNPINTSKKVSDDFLCGGAFYSPQDFGQTNMRIIGSGNLFIYANLTNIGLLEKINACTLIKPNEFILT